MIGRVRGAEADRPGPGSTGNDHGLISRSSHGDCGGISARLLDSLTRAWLLSIKKFLDRIFRHMVNETKVLFDVAQPLEPIVTQWALVLANLCGLVDVASQSRELGEGFSAAAQVGLVLAFVDMLFKLVVVRKRGGACSACVRIV